MTPERERLKRMIEDRALELRLRLNEVARRAGMSLANFARIRNGTVSITGFAAQSLDAALEWKPGGIQAILDGGDPTPISPVADSRPGHRAEVVTADGTRVPIALAKELADLTPTELDEVMKYVEFVKARIANRK